MRFYVQRYEIQAPTKKEVVFKVTSIISGVSMGQ